MKCQKSSRNETLFKRIKLTIFRKIKHNSPRGAPFRKTVVKTQILLEVIIAEILEAASAVILEDSEDLDQIIKDLNGRIRTKVHIRHDNSPIKTFRSKIQILFFSRNLPVSNLKIKTFKIKILKIKTHSLRVQISNRNSRLKSLLQILITCLIRNKLRSPVINVAILIT